jgi:L-ascorbate metabolism protein UlaG (beta-lactamase superfamily)
MKRFRELLLLAPVLLAVLGACSGISTTDRSRFPAPGPDRITFWGHACVHVDVGGIGIVTDPVFEERIFFRHRFVPAPPPEGYANVRIILVSHAHPDHLSRGTIATFPDSAVVLCPPGVAGELRGSGRTVRAMAPGESHAFPGGRVIALAAHHMGDRYGLGAASDGRALAFVIETPKATIYYSGDTNMYAGFSEVGWRFAPDVAILNINGHLPPREAARAAWATRAPVIIPAHWGAYGYWIFGGLRRPRGEDELRRLVGDRLLTLQTGQSLALDRLRTSPGIPSGAP